MLWCNRLSDLKRAAQSEQSCLRSILPCLSWSTQKSRSSSAPETSHTAAGTGLKRSKTAVSTLPLHCPPIFEDSSKPEEGRKDICQPSAPAVLSNVCLVGLCSITQKRPFSAQQIATCDIWSWGCTSATLGLPGKICLSVLVNANQITPGTQKDLVQKLGVFVSLIFFTSEEKIDFLRSLACSAYKQASADTESSLHTQHHQQGAQSNPTPPPPGCSGPTSPPRLV